MSSKPILYSLEESPPFRGVQLTVYALGIDVENRYFKAGKDEFLNEKYMKKNPQHTVPLLELEDGNCIGDSHAIIAYLVGKYAKNDSLYPKDLYLRAQVDRFLHFDSGLLFSELRKLIYYLKQNPITDSIREQYFQHFETNFGILNTFLNDRVYIAGDQLTIADLSLVATISSIDTIFPINAENFPNLAKWFNNLKQLPYYERANQQGINLFKEYMRNLINEK